ncbi:MAG: peroxide stress protein YaaA [Actinomycetia bacterium]|nr:peroxide stress protein YaaA [Actinomycetes bacterium]
MSRRLILIPPSEGKAFGGEGPPWESLPGARDHPLHASRREVIDALDSTLAARSMTRAAAAKLLGVKGDALQRAIGADLDIDEAATLPAIERYDGVLYQHLDAASLDARSRRRLVRSVRIFSGLWGVVAPDEAIPDYRLKMSASLRGLGKLSTWWRDSIAEALARDLKGAELWNLLPQEHAAAFRAPLGSVECTATFLKPGRGGEPVAVSHWNKALKGALVAHLVRNPSAEPGDLVGWQHPAGYRLDPKSLVEADGRMQLRFLSAD